MKKEKKTITKYTIFGIADQQADRLDTLRRNFKDDGVSREGKDDYSMTVFLSCAKKKMSNLPDRTERMKTK